MHSTWKPKVVTCCHCQSTIPTLRDCEIAKADKAAGLSPYLKTKLEVAGFSVPIEYIGKRLKDETVTVPAGRFENCQHVQILISMQNEMGQPVKGKAEYWYHPKVRNLVKEVTVTNYKGENSYTATSVLKSHTTKN